jgi:hypothetical protein
MIIMMIDITIIMNNYKKGRGGYYNRGGNRGGNYYRGNYRRGGYNRGYNNQNDYYDDGYNYNNEQMVEVEVSSSSQPISSNNNNYKDDIPPSGKEIEINSNNKNYKYKEDIEDDTYDDTYNSSNYYDPNENYDENEQYDDYGDDYGYDNNNNYNNDYNNNYSKNKSSKYDKMTFTNESGFTEMVDKQINYNNDDYISSSYLQILMIAEKPSIARAISEVLSNGKFKNHKTGRGKCLLTFDGYFQGIKARFTVSAVAGHVYTSDFLREHNKWDAIDPVELYDVPIVKLDAMRKMRMPQMIQKLASGKDILCLWLDCDSEGENICYEVIYNALPYLNKRNYQQIFRAKFSSLTKKDLKAAFDNLSEYADKNVSLSVDARQVIDLKIGVSFTRFLTSSILPALSDLDESFTMLSYGPCQTPTLWFCVNRQNEIKNFVSTPYYKLFVEIEVNGNRYKLYYDKKFQKKIELNDIISNIKKIKRSKSKRNNNRTKHKNSTSRFKYRNTIKNSFIIFKNESTRYNGNSRKSLYKRIYNLPKNRNNKICFNFRF